MTSERKYSKEKINNLEGGQSKSKWQESSEEKRHKLQSLGNRVLLVLHCPAIVQGYINSQNQIYFCGPYTQYSQG